MKRLTWLALLLLLAACAAPASERAADVPLPTVAPRETAAPAATPAATQLAASASPLLLIGWDDALGRVVRAVDPLTGWDAPGYARLPFDDGRDSDFIPPTAVSADGRRLAIVDAGGQLCYAYAGGETCGPRSSAVYLVDVAAWAIRAVPLTPDGWVGLLAFSPDGGRLALSVRDDDGGNTLRLLNATDGTMLATTALPFTPSQLGFGPDAATLVAYGQPEGEQPGITPPPPPRVLLLDVATLAPVWAATLNEVSSGHWCAAQCDAGHGVMEMVSRMPGVVLSPDGGRLLIAHADAARLTTVDLRQRAVVTVAIGRSMTWLERLLAATADVAHAKGPTDSLARYVALSPDGARLYLGGYDFDMSADGAGGWTVSETFPPLQVIDPGTGEVLQERDARAYWLQLTPDGARLLLRDLSANVIVTDVFDAATLATVGHIEGQDVLLARDLAGGVAFVGQSVRQSQSRFTLFDPLSLAAVAQWSADGPAWVVAMP